MSKNINKSLVKLKEPICKDCAEKYWFKFNIQYSIVTMLCSKCGKYTKDISIDYSKRNKKKYSENPDLFYC